VRPPCGAVLVEPGRQRFKLQPAQLAQGVEQFQHRARALAVRQVGIGRDLLGQRQGIAFDPLAPLLRELACLGQAHLHAASRLFQTDTLDHGGVPIRLGPGKLALVPMVDEQGEGEIHAVKPAITGRRRIAVQLHAHADIACLQAARQPGTRLGSRLLGAGSLQIRALRQRGVRVSQFDALGAGPGLIGMQLGRITLHRQQGGERRARSRLLGMGQDAIALGTLHVKLDARDIGRCNIASLEPCAGGIQGPPVQRGEFALQPNAFLRAPQIDPGQREGELLLTQRIGRIQARDPRRLLGRLDAQGTLVAPFDGLVDACQPVDLLVQQVARAVSHRGGILACAGGECRIGPLRCGQDVGLCR